MGLNMQQDRDDTSKFNGRCYDVCVIGTGPAGSSLVNSLRGSGLKTCVIESGERSVTPFSDRLRDVDSDGIFIKEYSRERVLGGASTTWSGLSAPMDPIDFETRDWVPYSGWPITRDQLLPYYKRAADEFRFPKLQNFLDDLGEARGGIEDRLDWQELQEKLFLASDPVQNFGEEFTEVYESDDVDLLTGYTALKLDGDVGSGAAQYVTVGNADGDQKRIEARTFVVACGGIENARLLLNSRFACPGGLGNDRDQVGRYFMNHPKNNYGCIKLTPPINELPRYFGFLLPADELAGYFGLRVNERLQRELGVLNSYVRFQPAFNWSDNPSVEAAVLMMKDAKYAMRLFKRFNKDSVVRLRDYSETGDDSDDKNQRRGLWGRVKLLGTMARHAPAVADYAYHRVMNKKAIKISKIVLRNFMEMAPDPNNRVMLSERTDVFGMPLAKICHNVTELDKASLCAVHQAMANEVKRMKIGTLESNLRPGQDPWPINYDASHHLGATRMGHDPSTSVVDASLRLHSCPNVYMAGGSVLPTSGNANPTFTLVALSIRLAEELRSVLSPKVVEAA